MVIPALYAGVGRRQIRLYAGSVLQGHKGKLIRMSFGFRLITYSSSRHTASSWRHSGRRTHLIAACWRLQVWRWNVRRERHIRRREWRGARGRASSTSRWWRKRRHISRAHAWWETVGGRRKACHVCQQLFDQLDCIARIPGGSGGIPRPIGIGGMPGGGAGKPGGIPMPGIPGGAPKAPGKPGGTLA